ncbi:MAG TPA: TonB-dependent receptor plug domain-containing protein, partial [Pyrinomonadaceae bacterium]|nr:TonB-dependent receptor plug domain-containing protein [Pyrinomonadaceae bacterium]
MNRLVVIFLLAICLTIPIEAQTENRARVSGLIKDQTNAAISGALVLLFNTQTRMERSNVSSAGGIFTFENVLPGDYEIRVTALGFAAQNQRVRVPPAGIDNLEIALTVGESRVTVTAEVGQTERIENVPQAVSSINSNEILQRATSVIAQIGEEEVGLNVQRTSPTVGAIVVRGLTGKNVVNYVDGVRYTNGAQRGGINTFLNLNDPSNFSTVEVLRGPNAAQYGSDSLGGAVNLLTKSPIFGDTAKFGGEIIPFFRTADKSFGSSVLISYGTNKLGGFLNVFGRRINTLRTADGIDSHSAVTRFLGLPSTILYDRNPNTEFTQYGGSFRLNYAPREDRQIVFFYQRGQQDEGKRFDQLLGGEGNLLADLRNLMMDFGYLRYVKQNFGLLDSASFTVSYNSQREERVNQGGQGNPFGDITNQYERTSSTGFSFFLDKQL